MVEGNTGDALRRRAPCAVHRVAADLPVAGERDVDDVGVQLLDALVWVAHARERSGAEVLDHDVGAADQAIDDLAAVGVVDVDVDRALVAVEVAVQARDSAQRVGDALVLHLDHVGAHVGENACRLGSGDDPREVADADALERQAAVLVGHGSSPWGHEAAVRLAASCSCLRPAASGPGHRAARRRTCSRRTPRG